jgi:hypothetical protein
MQMTITGTRAQARYRERLSPSLPVLVGMAVCGPMAALVFAPLDATIALIVGVLVAVAVVFLLVALAPIVEVRGTELRAGRAHIDAAYLGEPEALTAEAAREARGPGLDSRAWHLLRPGISGVVRVPVVDPRDPAPNWLIATRTPDRLAAAIRSARADAR